MKTIPAQSMPKLPKEVAALVRQGIYSLFELRDASAKYLLVTSKRKTEFYLLDDAGDVVVDDSFRSVDDADIVEAVSFTESPEETNTNSSWPSAYAR